MKKLAWILSLAMILSIAVNAQQQRGSTPMKDTSQMKNKKSASKSSGSSYQMKKGTSGKSTAKMTKKRGASMEQMEDTSKIKSKGKPVYRR